MDVESYALAAIEALERWEILDFYDRPVFFSLKDLTGQIYVAFWADQHEEVEHWLYLKISRERYAALRSGHIPIRQALSDPEEGLAYLVARGGGSPTLSILRPSEFDPAWLPEPDDALELPSSLLPQRSSTAFEAATKTNRQVWDLAFSTGNDAGEISSSVFGRALDTLQGLIYAIACGPDSNPKKIPFAIKQQHEYAVADVFQSSFGVRLMLKSRSLVDVAEENKSAKILTVLLDSAGNPSQFTVDIKRHNVLARGKIQHLLDILVDAGLSLKVDWSNPQGDRVSTKLSYIQLRDSLAALALDESSSSEVRQFPSKLVGVDVERDFFSLVDDTGEIISGKLSQELKGHQFEVPSFLEVKVQETCTIDPISDREKWSYVLLEIVGAHSPR